MLKPLQNYVLIKKPDPIKITESGIHIPGMALEINPIFEGTVVAVGDGLRLENGDIQPVELKVNDQVIFPKHTGTDIKLEGIEYTLIRESDVLAVWDFEDLRKVKLEEGSILEDWISRQPKEG